MDRWERIQEVLSAALERPTAERDAYVAQACGDDSALGREVRALLDAHARAGPLDLPPDDAAPGPGKQLLTLFEQVFRLDPDARAAYLDAVCANDSGLRRNVEALLEASAQTGSIAAFSPVVRDAVASWMQAGGHKPGDAVAHYELLEQLGSGGMGVVFKARDTRLNRTTALKFLPAHLSADGAAKERFMVEARAAARLTHPNVCTIYEVGETDAGQLFIAMAYCAGDTLKARIARGPLAVDEAVGLIRQIARGLGRAHEHGIVHRDVKPANVIVDPNEDVKIVDFGIAKMTDGDLTRSGTTLGTVAYMSPEQARGEAVDHRTDLWSLGVVFYEMLAGRRPFDGTYEHAVLYQILNEAPEPLGALRPDAPHALVRVIETALAKDPDRRHASTDAFLRALDALDPPAHPASVHRRDRTGSSEAQPSGTGRRGTGTRTGTGALHPEGERRQATVAVSLLLGYDALVEQLFPDEVEQVIDRFRTLAELTAQRHGGMVNQCSGDELTLLFGIPETHEDDTVRAVRAARDLHAHVRELSDEIAERTGEPLRLVTGLDTGLVAAQPLSDQDRIYRITGRPAQAAGLLAVQAEAGEILATPESRRLLAPFFETEAREPVRLKGHRAPVTPYRIGEESGLESRLEAAERTGLTAHTGREKELDALHRSLDRAVQGEGRCVTVVGEAGLGKSRLLYEFRQQIDRREVLLVRGRCQSYGAHTPYLPFVEALRDHLGLQGEEPADRIAQRILDVSPELEAFVPFYLSVLSIRHDAYPLPDGLEGDQFRLAMQQALAAFFTLGAEDRPHVLLFEDWHWVDDGSHEALEQIVELAAAYPLLVIVTYRPDYGVDWRASVHPTPVHLQPLGVEASRAILASVLGSATFPEAPGRLLHERTGGNPFFLEETAKALREEGTLRIDDGRVVLTRPLDKAHLPNTVQAVIRTRLHRLDREAQAVVRLGAVVGREFTLGVLRHILPEQAALRTALETLRAAGLVRQTRVLPEPTYRFRHVLMQEVAYESLLAHQRRHFHGLVGAALETLYPDRAEEQPDVLAQHFSQAGDWGKAVHYGLAAARRATGLSQFRDALRLFEQTQAWLARQPESRKHRTTLIELLLEQERLCETLGRRERQQELIDELTGLAEADDDAALRAAVYLRQGDLDLLLNRFGAAEAVLQKALTMFREIDDEVGERKALRSLGMLCWHTDRSEEALVWIKAALAISRRRADRGLRGDLTNLGQVLMSMNRLDEALEPLQEARDLMEREGASMSVPLPQHTLSRLYLRRGDVEQAKTLLQSAISLQSALPTPIEQTFLLTSLANLYWTEGEFEESLRLYEEVTDLSRKAGHAEGLTQALRSTATLLLQLRRYADALPYLEETASLFARMKHPADEADTWSKIAACRQHLGHTDQALDALAHTARLHQQTGDHAARLDALEGKARLLRQKTTDPAPAVQVYHDALTLARDLDDLHAEGRIRNSLAILAFEHADFESALDHYRVALACFQDLDDTVHQALIFNSLGVTLRRLNRSDEAVVALEEGAAIARRSGQSLLEAHALAALGEIAHDRTAYDEALGHFHASLELRGEIADWKGRGWMHLQLARTHTALADSEQAATHKAEALKIARAHGLDALAVACADL